MFGSMMNGMMGAGNMLSPLAQALMQRVPQPGAPAPPPVAPQGAPAMPPPPLPPSQANGMWNRSAAPPQRPGGPAPQGQGAPVVNPNKGEVTPLPSPPPNSHSKVPPASERWRNAQELQKAYANNWQPNPMLLRALMVK